MDDDPFYGGSLTYMLGEHSLVIVSFMCGCLFLLSAVAHCISELSLNSYG
jgi:hypothetical protein